MSHDSQQPSDRRATTAGFTLIELMVVVLIIAILLSIAIPTFLGAQTKAKDRAAQTSVRNTLTNARTIYADTQTYMSVDVAALNAVDKGITAVIAATVSSGPKVISVSSVSATMFVAAVKSDSGTCFYIRDDIASGGNATQYATSTGVCSAATAPTGVYKGSW